MSERRATFPGSNFSFDVTCIGRDHFDALMSIVFASHSKATHYWIIPTDKIKRMVLYWHEPSGVGGDKGVQPLPYPMELKAASDFVWHWLQNVEYSDEPCHDGSNKPGWRMYDKRKLKDSNSYAFVVIEPTWMEYWK